MAYGAGAAAFGLVGRAMLGGFFRASAQVPAGFSPLPEGGSPFGAMQSAMLLVPTVALLAGVAMVAVGGYLAWKDWKLNHKK